MWFLVLGGIGLCDVVELTNGDRLTGTVESLSGGKLALTTPYAGKVVIDWKQVRSVTTKSEYEVDLIGGQTLTGAITPAQPGQYQIGTGRGPTTLATEIQSIRVPLDTHMGLLSGWKAAADLG